MALPPVRVAMSSSMALRRSPKPGALTAAHCNVPRRLVHHEGGQRFAFDVLSNDQEGLAHLGVCSSNGSRSFIELISFHG